MSLPEKIWDENPLKKLAEKSLKAPTMYLIALREHVNRGQKALGDMLDTVSEAAVAQPAKTRQTQDS